MTRPDKAQEHSASGAGPGRNSQDGPFYQLIDQALASGKGKIFISDVLRKGP